MPKLSHGHSSGKTEGAKRKRTRTYQIWTNFKQRCSNPKNGRYSSYGKRGIKVCKRWHKFENFLEDMGEVPEGFTIERIDNNGDYCKKNCKWAQRYEQYRNRTTNRILTLNGVSKCITDWAIYLGLDPSSLNQRISRHGWTIEEALTTRKGEAKNEH